MAFRTLDKRTQLRGRSLAPLAHCSPVREATDGREPRVIAALRAQLEREKDARVAAERRFAELAAHARDVVYLLDAHGTPTYVSAACELLSGRDASHHTTWPAFVHEGDLDEVTAAFAKLRDGEPVEVEYRVVRPDGTVRWAADRATPIRGAHGEVTHVIGIVHDATSERERELEVRALQKAQGTAGLTRGIAHDFSNVLQVVVGCTMLAARPDTPPDRARSMLLRAKDVALRGGEIVRRLSGFTGRDEEKRSPFLLDATVQRSATMLVPVLGEHIRLDLQLGAPGATVLGAEVQIEQLLVNLAGNARDAMTAGGTLVFRTSLTGSDHVELVVSDTGSGMDAETRAHAFEPLFTTKPGHPGLGLATVQSVVQQLGGVVELESELRRGTTVRIRLPARAGAGTATTPRVTRALSGTALLLEDETVAREAIRRALEENGLDVWEALDDAHALAVAEEHPPDLLVSDVLMPRTFGPDLAKQLRARHPNMSVLFIAGDPDGVPLTDASATGVLPKPFAEDELVRRVRLLLGHGREAPANEVVPRPSGVRTAVRPKTVLVVEDEETSRTLLRRVLGEAGYHALAAGTAAEAAAVARRHDVDVLVTDLRLPDGKGDVLAADLKRERPELAVLYVSGDRARPTAAPGRFLEKPVDLDELLEVLGALAAPPGTAGSA